MSDLDEDGRKKKPVITIGEDLSDHSLYELAERISTLTAEIARSEQAIAEKRAGADVAASVFKR